VTQTLEKVAAARVARGAAACTFPDVGERDVSLKDFLGGDDPQAGVELGGAAGEQGGLA